MRRNGIRTAAIVLAAVSLLVALGYFLRIDRFGLAEIEWVDMVKIEGQLYRSEYVRVPVEQSEVGEKIGEVRFNVSEHVHNGYYRFRNGDAAFLEAGTELFRLNSRDDGIAAKINESYFLYGISR
ncbi:MAG: hypothetical protein KBA30_07075 [Clostridia bacterium]|nr:hypothetical protein [Clostridia bacterium]